MRILQVSVITNLLLYQYTILIVQVKPIPWIFFLF